MSINVYVWRKLGDNKSIISPNEFLKWAKQDIKGGNPKNIANTLSNTKRAIHARIDEILYALRIQYASGWPKSLQTSDKLKAIKQLKIPGTSNIDLITKRRNDLEHSYLLPSLKQIRADVEAVEMWLDKSKSYLRPSVVLIGLPVTRLGSSYVSEKKSTFIAEFAKPDKVEFYWDAKKEIVTLSKSGATSRKNYHDYSWKELIRIQKKSYLSNDTKQIAPSISIATRLYKAYEGWVLGKRGPSFMATKKFS
ncbi:MAG: hypothetical protein PHY02_04205 [Phycisphaerae bacterium]|nr:hypothetical protein [Phycisphaerae bacterium]